MRVLMYGSRTWLASYLIPELWSKSHDVIEGLGKDYVTMHDEICYNKPTHVIFVCDPKERYPHHEDVLNDIIDFCTISQCHTSFIRDAEGFPFVPQNNVLLYMSIVNPITADFSDKNTLIEWMCSDTQQLQAPQQVSVLPTILPMVVSWMLEKQLGSYMLVNPGRVCPLQTTIMYKQFVWKDLHVDRDVGKERRQHHSQDGNYLPDASSAVYECLRRMALSSLKDLLTSSDNDSDDQNRQ